MTVIEVALYAASAAIAAGGAIAASKAQSASYNAQAQAQEYQAARDTEMSGAAWQQAGAREDMQRRRAAVMMGRNRAIMAGTNIDSSTGSTALLTEQNADDAELDALTVRYEGALNARGLAVQSTLDTYGAAASRSNASAAIRGGYWSATGALLQGAGQAYGAYNRSISGVRPKTNSPGLS